MRLRCIPTQMGLEPSFSEGLSVTLDCNPVLTENATEDLSGSTSSAMSIEPQPTFGWCCGQVVMPSIFVLRPCYVRRTCSLKELVLESYRLMLHSPMLDIMEIAMSPRRLMM
jgi:hypothetical protein